MSFGNRIHDIAPMFVCPEEDVERSPAHLSSRLSLQCLSDTEAEAATEGIDLEDWWSLTQDRLQRIFATLDTDSDGRVSISAAHESLGRYGLRVEDLGGLCARLDATSRDLTVELFIDAVREVMLDALFASAKAHPGRATVVDYSEAECLSTTYGSAVEVRSLLGPRPSRNRWIDARGETVLKTLAVRQGFHPLALEDALMPQQRPKVERYPQHVLFVLPRVEIVGGLVAPSCMPLPHETLVPDLALLPQFEATNVAIFLTYDFDSVITYTGGGSDQRWARRVLAKLDKSYTRLREADAQHLTYEILDALVDGLFPVVRAYRRALYAERAAIRSTKFRRDLAALGILKNDLDKLFRLSRNLYRVVNHIIDDDRVLHEVVVYLRDVRDNVADFEDELGALQREVTTIEAEVDKYFQSKQERTIYALTVVTTVFLPLQFLTGVFGMNLRIPEADFRYSYHIFWLGTALYFLIAATAIRSTTFASFHRRPNYHPSLHGH